MQDSSWWESDGDLENPLESPFGKGGKSKKEGAGSCPCRGFGGVPQFS